MTEYQQCLFLGDIHIFNYFPLEFLIFCVLLSYSNDWKKLIENKKKIIWYLISWTEISRVPS